MIIDDELIDEVTEKAAQSPRLRMNHNLHESLDSAVQRMINVLLPGTVLPIHRHLNAAETIVLLRGKLDVILYNGKGEETERRMLDAAAGQYGVHVPVGQWHSVEVIMPSAIFEVKEGPYQPLTPEETMD